MSTTSVRAPDGTTLSEWYDVDDYDADQSWRVIYGEMRTVTEGVGEWASGEVSARAEATQLANGALDDKGADWPGVQVACTKDSLLTPGQARRLAVALLQAADEADGWMGR